MKEVDRKPIEKTGPKEVLWFIGLWAAGVVTILIVGGLIKLVI